MTEATAMGSTTVWLGLVGLLMLGQPALGLNRANKKPDSNIRHGKSKDTTLHSSTKSWDDWDIEILRSLGHIKSFNPENIGILITLESLEPISSLNPHYNLPTSIDCTILQPLPCISKVTASIPLLSSSLSHLLPSFLSSSLPYLIPISIPLIIPLLLCSSHPLFLSSFLPSLLPSYLPPLLSSSQPPFISYSTPLFLSSSPPLHFSSSPPLFFS